MCMVGYASLRIGHARCVVLFPIERHTDTLSSGWFHGSDSPYGAVCSIHSIGLEVESSYCLYRFPPTTKSDGISTFQWLIQQVDGRMIVLSDTGFHAAEGDPSNLKLCQR